LLPQAQDVVEGRAPSAIGRRPRRLLGALPLRVPWMLTTTSGRAPNAYLWATAQCRWDAVGAFLARAIAAKAAGLLDEPSAPHSSTMGPPNRARSKRNIGLAKDPLHGIGPRGAWPVALAPKSVAGRGAACHGEIDELE
jgi:hypothetical protein